MVDTRHMKKTLLPPGIQDRLKFQAHHQNLEFYDRNYKKGAYLKTHAAHRTRWHPEDSN